MDIPSDESISGKGRFLLRLSANESFLLKSLADARPAKGLVQGGARNLQVLKIESKHIKISLAQQPILKDLEALFDTLMTAKTATQFFTRRSFFYKWDFPTLFSFIFVLFKQFNTIIAEFKLALLNF